MKITRHHLLSVSFAAMAPVGLRAQGPFDLLHSISSPDQTLQTGAHFGSSVAMDGTYAVVGAPDDDVSVAGAGVVKVFDSTSGALVLQILNPNPEIAGHFGGAVAISGSRVVVGVPGDDVGFIDAGRAYVYDLASASPTAPVLTLSNPTPGADDMFGHAVVIAGLRVAVAAPSDDTGAKNAGSVYVYNTGSSTPSAVLNNPAPAAGDQFGSSVAISGNLAVGGAPYDSTGAVQAGSAYVYDLGIEGRRGVAAAWVGETAFIVPSIHQFPVPSSQSPILQPLSLTRVFSSQPATDDPLNLNS